MLRSTPDDAVNARAVAPCAMLPDTKSVTHFAIVKFDVELIAVATSVCRFISAASDAIASVCALIASVFWLTASELPLTASVRSFTALFADARSFAASVIFRGSPDFNAFAYRDCANAC
jgi:hypothetical protein